MTIPATCTSCATATRLVVPHLLMAAVSASADEQAVGTVAWICQSCADLSIHTIDESALLALMAGGAELIGGSSGRSPQASRTSPDQLPEPPKEPTS